MDHIRTTMCLIFNFIVSFINLSEYILGVKFSINPRLGQAVATSITGMLVKLKELFNMCIAGIISVNKTSDVYQVPVFQRSDGVTLKLGYMVVKEEKEVVFTIKNIMVREDLSEVTLTLIPIQLSNDKSVVLEDEEIVCGVEGVEVVKGSSIVEEVARNGMEIVASTITYYPLHVQKFVRKHQLSVMMRKQVQQFLGGFSMSGNCSLGCVDWRLDPAILGLEKCTYFSLEYRVERYVEQTSHMDLLMGKEWDVRTLNGTDGYRIILTLELAVDFNQELLMKMHATIATGKVNKKSYREVCLNDTTGLHIMSNRRLSDITHHGTSGVTNHGLTLAWDEFPTRIHSVETSPCQAASAPSIDVSESMDYMLPGNLQGFPSSTSTAFTSLERLLASIPQSQLVFNSPIKEVSGEYTFTSAAASSGPNTSTPADALNTSGDVLRVGDLVHNLESKHNTPQSSPSLPGHRNLDDVEDSTSKCCNGEESQDHGEENETDSAVTKAKVNGFKVPIVKELLRSGYIYQNCKITEKGQIILGLENSLTEGSNIKADIEPSTNICMNAKSWTFQKSENPAATEDLDQGKQNNNDPVSPFKMSSQIRVHQYLQTSPTPAAKACKCEANSVTAKEEDYNSSPRSQSTPSPFSDLSSRAGSRLGRGMFYGSPPASGVTDPVCPFPEDWQYNSITDTVENNDEID